MSARYECLTGGCDFQTDSEHACWEHALATGHERFADYETQLDESIGQHGETALGEVYEPLDDPLVHIECEPDAACVNVDITEGLSRRLKED